MLIKKVGLSRLRIIKFEQGQVPTPDRQKKIAEAFNLPLDFFTTVRAAAEKETGKSIAKRIKPIELNTFRKKLLKAINFRPEDQLFIELAIDQIVARYELDQTIEDFQSNIKRQKG